MKDSYASRVTHTHTSTHTHTHKQMRIFRMAAVFNGHPFLH